MTNKGLEVIEAIWLFDVPASKIEIIVQPESIIHSMVAYKDGSVMAQMGAPDMQIPIQLALTWPERIENPFGRIDFDKITKLNFIKPDLETFEALNLAYKAAQTGGTLPCAMNAANEVAVELFLNGKISFLQITELISQVMKNHKVNNKPVLEDIIDTDSESRKLAWNIFNGGLKWE
jgi:1-deoxy-D-xylulose-5-phosphate reductoisomerase